jgi:hypothetical protein
MVRGVGERPRHGVRHKQNHRVRRIEFGADRHGACLAMRNHLRRLQWMMQHRVQQFFRARAVVVDAVSAGPAIASKQQRHRKILLAIRRRALGVMRSIRFARPREVSVRRLGRVGDVHVRPRPVPEGVKHRLMSKLHGNHHAVAHAFGAHIMVRPVGQVHHRAGGVFAVWEDNRLRMHVLARSLPEQLVVGRVDARVDACLGVAGLAQQVLIVPGRVCTAAISERLRMHNYGGDTESQCNRKPTPLALRLKQSTSPNA